MGKCLFMRKGESHTAPASYQENFADNTWEQIIDACQKNAVPETWLVGDQKSMTINGVDYPIDIIGKNHDLYYGTSVRAPLTFQMHNCYVDAKTMNGTSTNVNGWFGSLMRGTHLPNILTMMPSEVSSAIRNVLKKSILSADGTIKNYEDKLFLLSEYEIFGKTTYSPSQEEDQYEYYMAGNSKIKTRNGTNAWWWLRSIRSDNTTNFCVVNTSGAAGSYGAAVNFSVAFAFCF